MLMKFELINKFTSISVEGRVTNPPTPEDGLVDKTRFCN